jgi:Transposase DDE domain
MYIDIVPNRQSPPAILLREGWREGRKTRKRTLANLSHWPKAKIDQLRRLLRDEPLVSPDDLFETARTQPHGHVDAILGTIRRLGLERLIAPTRSPERDLVIAMIAERLIHPCSKLETTRVWQTTTLAEELQVADATEDALYAALDWLSARQAGIEARLAARHLREGGVVLYDLSSSYYEGRTCPLARFGHDRDGHTGRPIIVYGVVTDEDGRPIAVRVYPGNTSDSTTVADQVETVRQQFGLAHVVLVGDRGLLTQPQIDRLRATSGVGWITALRSTAIRALVDAGALQLSLFDTQHLAEITTPAYPGERLIACFNPLLADERRRKREELLAATERNLTRLARDVARRTKTPMPASTIGLRAGKILGRFKVGKHFTLTIADGTFAWQRREAAIAQETALDGIYILRTSEPADRLSAAETVRTYKRLAHVERAFRCFKGVDLRVRPIYHRSERRVPAHIFLCLLAYYVEWHLRRALAPILFEDEQLPIDRLHRDPVLPATCSAAARQKKATHLTTEGLPVQSFDSLLEALATRCRTTLRLKRDATVTITQVPPPTPLQRRAYELLGLFPVTAR